MYPEIVGSRGGLAGIMSLVQLAAETSVNVLVHGETGTGKELIAHAIHRRSSRNLGPFIVANCAAIPHELMESEMFGHVRGAYTGAFREHKGYFDAARGGTLLLDEIGDLHLDLQAKILHVVESGDYRMVGSTRAEHNRARLISATNRPLGSLIREGKFRADLFYRLDVFTIDIPPLRDRGDDVLDLANYFLEQVCQRQRRDLPRLSCGAVAALRKYTWPGNVRELRNCMERAAMLTTDPVVRRENILRTLESPHRGPVEQPVRRLAEVERDMIESALRQFGGNRTRAAAALGISRRTLQIKLKRYAAAEPR